MKINRNLIILLVIFCNLVYSLVFSFFSVIVSIRNQTNTNFSVCEANHIFFPLEMACSFILLFRFMILFTGSLLYTIIDSRCKIAWSNSHQNRNQLRRDIKFAVTVCVINISNIFLDFSHYMVNIVVRMLKLSFWENR